jgi:hypothetical protein
MDHDAIGPEVMEGAVVGLQRRDDCRWTTYAGYDDVAVSNYLVLERKRVLDCHKSSSRLPTHGFEPALENVEQGPAGEHPLIGYGPRELVP